MLSEPEALEIIRETAANSARVVYTKHAKERMSERSISRIQVDRCLKRGGIVEGPAPETTGDCGCLLKHYTAGDLVHVKVAINKKQDNYRLYIVTVY